MTRIGRASPPGAILIDRSCTAVRGNPDTAERESRSTHAARLKSSHHPGPDVCHMSQEPDQRHRQGRSAEHPVADFRHDIPEARIRSPATRARAAAASAAGPTIAWWSAAPDSAAGACFKATPLAAASNSPLPPATCRRLRLRSAFGPFPRRTMTRCRFYCVLDRSNTTSRRPPSRAARRAHLFDAVPPPAGRRREGRAPLPATSRIWPRSTSRPRRALAARPAGRVLDPDTFTSRSRTPGSPRGRGGRWSRRPCVAATAGAGAGAAPAPPTAPAWVLPFNNVACLRLRSRQGRARSPRDIDVHHGTATQIFEDDQSVLSSRPISFRATPGPARRPSRLRHGPRAHVNADRARRRRRLLRACAPPGRLPDLTTSRDLTILSVGYDAHVQDPLAQMQVHRGYRGCWRRCGDGPRRLRRRLWS